MNSYYIEELQSEMTYIELRLLTLIDCDVKIDKINKIMLFLHNHHFLVNLTTIGYQHLSASDYTEQNNVMSLTIDVANDRLRFKFWNGATVQWLYHTDDVFHALDTGREKFTELYDKYEDVTELILDFGYKWKNIIYHISYQYAVDGFDIIYKIIFTNDVKRSNSAVKILGNLNKQLSLLDDKDLNFKIEHDYQPSGCVPCEEAKKEREKLESQEN